ncbi:MAG: carbamoyltransferase HypF [Acidobacteria bacterium]|nr:carbamoyltransferase HypF [Acidobacteriota bacterium]
MTPRHALRIRVRGIVQGVGFRPFVYRAASRHGIAGHVLNGDEGVEIHAEGAPEDLARFAEEIRSSPPPAARISAFEAEPAGVSGAASFAILGSEKRAAPTVRVAPDLPVCAACLAEMRDPADRRHGYPYVNCTDCGPRFSVIEGLPYDRPRTTMKSWPLCERCRGEYEDPLDRRFHAQPVACPACGPHFAYLSGTRRLAGDAAAVAAAAAALARGEIVAVKGIGGYHLACDAANAVAVLALRERKYRKERPFALLARDLATARGLCRLDAPAEELLVSAARPIVLAPARVGLPLVAPDTDELGLMLPYAPLHELLFDAGAPAVLVLTSANRSSEPIAYRDEDALRSLAGIADGFLVGERPIARRVDDSVARAGAFGPVVLRRGRGYAPAPAATFPDGPPVLATGADLKNAVTLVVGGQAFVSQHIGDLDHEPARVAFHETLRDLCAMWEVAPEVLIVARDLHPDYVSSRAAREITAARHVALQHHRAHVASVLAERGAWDARVVGFAWDGTGYGDDGTIWGGEVFAGCVAGGFERVAHLRPAVLPGGDAAALYPPQAAAGFLAQLDLAGDLSGAPFLFPERFARALDLARRDVRCFPTTSVGRLFDAAAALCGFVREISYEGQAAAWLEQLARRGAAGRDYPLPWAAQGLDFRPLLAALVEERRRGADPAALARGFHEALASALVAGARRACEAAGTDVLVLSGGVFQNELLLRLVRDRLERDGGPQAWTNRAVPPNDGGISLGQAALAAFHPAAAAPCSS